MERQSITAWLGSAAGPCVPPPRLGLSWEMSSPQLHDFCIEPQGNRDEGPENLTQAHEDAKVRAVLAMLLQALHKKKNEDVASPGLEMASSGKQMLLGQGLSKLQGEMLGEVTTLEVKLPGLISDALGSAAPCMGKLQTIRAALGPSPRELPAGDCTTSCAELPLWAPVTRADAEIWHLSFKGSFGPVCRSHPPLYVVHGAALKPKLLFTLPARWDASPSLQTIASSLLGCGEPGLEGKG